MAQIPLIRPGSVALMERPRAKRGTYFVQTWGCQMNEEDSEQMTLYLEGLGFAKTKDWTPDGQLRWCWLELDDVATAGAQDRRERIARPLGLLQYAGPFAFHEHEPFVGHSGVALNFDIRRRLALAFADALAGYHWVADGE